MKRVAWIIGFLVVLAVVGYLARKQLLLAYVSWSVHHKHPVGPNQPVHWAPGPDQPPAKDRPPNIVVILADDLGFNDVSFFGGGTIKTPAIDTLAKAGVAFPRAYSAAPICAPSRAALLTSRYATRSGFEFTPTPNQMGTVLNMFAGEDGRTVQPKINQTALDAAADFDSQGLPASEVTLAKVLRERGYHTVHIGKWHLGSLKEFRPGARGFDESLMMEGCLYSPEHAPETLNARHPRDPIDATMWAGGQHAVSFNDGPWFAPIGYLTDYFTDEAVKVIAANRNRPFLLFLAHWAVHVPMQAAQEDYDAVAGIADHSSRVHAAMVRSLDRSVERVLAALKANGLEENTLVVFTSDNGGPDYVGLPDLNRPYRGWKLTMFEGGTHVAHFMRWPGHIKPGTTYDLPVSHLDIMPTAVAAAGGKMPSDRTIDGVDLMPYLLGRKPGRPHETLYWREGSYQAVLDRTWKLQTSQHPRKDWLFDLEKDPTEKNNLASRNPQKVAELQALLDRFNKAQAPPLWPSIAELPIYIDKTVNDPVTDTDEYIFWPN
jgi:arylsulfatase A-like enzyme